MRAYRIHLVLSLGLAIGAIGCSGDSPTELTGEAQFVDSKLPQPNNPPGAIARQLFPLSVGNEWRWRRTFVAEEFIDGEEPTSETFLSTQTGELIGTEELFGREYVIEQQQLKEDESSEIFTSWNRYRQDRAGLYEADIATSTPPTSPKAQPQGQLSDDDAEARANWVRRTGQALASRWDAHEHRGSLLAGWEKIAAKLLEVEHARRPSRPSKDRPGGVLPDEITRLSYPLHPEGSWTIREDPFFGATVHAHEILDLPAGHFPGWRIRYDSSLFGDDDLVLVWYGRAGMLALRLHIEAQLVDLDGEIIGTLRVTENMVLDYLQVAAPGRAPTGRSVRGQ